MIVVNSVVLLNKINIYLSYLGFTGLVWICSLVLVVWIDLIFVGVHRCFAWVSVASTCWFFS